MRQKYIRVSMVKRVSTVKYEIVCGENDWNEMEASLVRNPEPKNGFWKQVWSSFWVRLVTAGLFTSAAIAYQYVYEYVKQLYGLLPFLK